MGVDKTLHFARQLHPDVPRAIAKTVVQNCRDCSSIDPAPARWDPGALSVDSNWKRVACDVTHYGGHCYLTLIDCGPSRFALWRKMRSEDDNSIVEALEQVLYERGAPEELLFDNAPAFHSQRVTELCSMWGIGLRFRCAYRPSGNGIIERHHRTIKALAARAAKDPREVLFWYNAAPKDICDPLTSPFAAVYTYEWRYPTAVATPDGREANAPYKVGDRVYVKPPNARCCTRWPEGVITGANSATNIVVDGMARHVGDLRQVPDSDTDTEVEEEDQEVEDEAIERPLQVLRRSQRVRAEPCRYEVSDYP
jgi:hypothetical protein